MIRCPDCNSENVAFVLNGIGIVIIAWDSNEHNYYSQLICTCGTKFRRYFKLQYLYTKKND